ncbi:MAG: DUF6527 family protein [Candidatus Saccharimonadales bacterium]
MQVHFVDVIPKAEVIQYGHLYISLKYNMTSHRCASGCGQLVPLPLSPADWSLSYNGDTVSLSPSIGNGVLACHSHYFIKNSKVVWASDMSSAQAQQQQAVDAERLKRHMEDRSKVRQAQSFVQRIITWVKDRF